MPKCPLCVAAYVAIFTGIGLSLPVANFVRTTLIVLCAASLAFMAVLTTLGMLHPLVMAQGRELARGTPHEVLRNSAVIEAYLGKRYAQAAH